MVLDLEGRLNSAFRGAWVAGAGWARRKGPPTQGNCMRRDLPAQGNHIRRGNKACLLITRHHCTRPRASQRNLNTSSNAKQHLPGIHIYTVDMSQRKYPSGSKPVGVSGPVDEPSLTRKQSRPLEMPDETVRLLSASAILLGGRINGESRTPCHRPPSPPHSPTHQ